MPKSETYGFWVKMQFEVSVHVDATSHEEACKKLTVTLNGDTKHPLYDAEIQYQIDEESSDNPIKLNQHFYYKSTPVEVKCQLTDKVIENEISNAV